MPVSVENMGLWTWPKSETGKADVTVAMNYLRQPELDDLYRFTNLLLDFMIDWLAGLHGPGIERIAEATQLQVLRCSKLTMR
jgi:hypothetical protein